MSISLDAQCYVCYLRRAVETASALGDSDTAAAFARDVMRQCLDAPEGTSSPSLVPDTEALYRKYYGITGDRFREEKRYSNEFVRERLPQIRQTVASAADPLLAALQVSILGNYLDYSALQGEVDFSRLDEMLAKALTLPLDGACYARLLADLANARKLLYLTDNAGEIGFDRVLGETIQARFPGLEITFCVRGGPVQNDATREDAEFMGIPFPVIDNGIAIGGIVLSQISRACREAMDAADVILAKGMGNAETLYGCGYPIYYAFLVKCPRFMAYFHQPKLTPMLIRDPGPPEQA